MNQETDTSSSSRGEPLPPAKLPYAKPQVTEIELVVFDVLNLTCSYSSSANETAESCCT